MDLRGLSPSDRELAEQIILRCISDRVFFFEEILKVQLEDWQREVLVSLDNGEKAVSIRSAVGVGKTMLVSGLAIHYLLFRDDVKVIVTSPSFNQLTDGIIPEVKHWIAKLPRWLHKQLVTTSERVTRLPETASNFISFRTARKETPEALQGIHATHVLLLVDEASGVADVVYEAGSGTMSTEGAITVLISNPTRVTGLFYKTQTKLKHLWKTWKVTAFQSSRVSSDFPERMAGTYGIDSLQYKVRVLGEFPEGNADSVIPRGWVEAAIGRDVDVYDGVTNLPNYREAGAHDELYSCIWGVDPGRGGDPSGFCEVIGDRKVTFLHELHSTNLMAVVGYVKRRWDETPVHLRPSAICVDVVGMGAGVADRLEELGLPVVQVNVAEMAAMSDRYVRMRPELWFEGRAFFERKTCVISEDIPEALRDKFVEELSETAFKDHSSGKLDVESKKDLKARGLPSPNLADAFLLTRATEAAVSNGVLSGSKWDKPLNYTNPGVY